MLRIAVITMLLALTSSAQTQSEPFGKVKSLHDSMSATQGVAVRFNGIDINDAFRSLAAATLELNRRVIELEKKGTPR